MRWRKLKTIAPAEKREWKDLTESQVQGLHSWFSDRIVDDLYVPLLAGEQDAELRACAEHTLAGAADKALAAAARAERAWAFIRHRASVAQHMKKSS
jgi:hypothetical protein